MSTAFSSCYWVSAVKALVTVLIYGTVGELD